MQVISRLDAIPGIGCEVANLQWAQIGCKVTYDASKPAQHLIIAVDFFLVM